MIKMITVVAGLWLASTACTAMGQASPDKVTYVATITGMT